MAMPCAHADGGPAVTGQTGLISMPDARVAPDGTWRTGLSFMRPYQALWTGVSVLPWLETSFRFTRIYHVPGGLGPEYGDYKDKSVDVKALIFPERRWWPSMGVGVQDIAGGTGLFRAYYGVASKQVGEFDFTAGYGVQRIDGAFGGVRWTPSALPRWSLVAEYDAYNYRRDVGALESGAARYEKEPALGLEYRTEWWGVKAFNAHGNVGVNAYLSVPLEKREFIPKVQEPPPYTRIQPRPTEAQWRSNREHQNRMEWALLDQYFSNLAVRYENEQVHVSLTNTRISSMPRAVGRAARTVLAFAPLETREVRITYLAGTLPVAEYSFVDARLLQRYFNGMASREQLAPYVDIKYAAPQAAAEATDRVETLDAAAEPVPLEVYLGRHEGDAVAFLAEHPVLGHFRIRPQLATMLNDPSGVFKYDLSAIGSWSRYLAQQTFLHAELKYTLLENLTDSAFPSNSTLPHVRSDVAEYKRGGRLKLSRVVVNRFFHPRERVYARASAGIYEEMFSGFGGQVLYLPGDGRWAVDVSSDWVKQRDFEGWLGHQEYSTVTTIGSLHYRMAKGVTATLRAGRFLAGDEGVRGEIKRRFTSGFEIGAWYTVTNGNDITSPGSPANPYNDKGVFISMPLDTMLALDTQATASIAVAPWTRDVGQMVASPGDLYSLLERPVVQMHEHDGLVRLGDREDDYALPSLGTGRDRIWPDLVGHDLVSARRAAGEVDWARSAFMASAAVLGSSLLDKSAFRFSDKHRNAGWMKQGVRVGDALPLAALGLSGVFAWDDSRPQLSDAGVAALEAGGLAFVGSTGLKYVVGRARPTAGLGNNEFEPGSSQDRFHSFPSRHSAVMWAAVTPYAKEFGMPWLYGVAAITNAARIGSREHWVSDTVASSLLGYAAGHLAWQARRDSRKGKNGPSLAVGPGTVGLEWELQ